MRIFDLKEVVMSLSTPANNALLNSIELYKGKTLNIEKVKKVEKLKKFARDSGVLASNFIGNVFIGDNREKALLSKGQSATNFEEHMILGYNNALDLIDEVYKFQPFDRSFISTLHYYIYKDYNPEIGGRFKDTQNYVQEFAKNGSLRTVLIPAVPEEVVPLLDNLIYQFNMCMLDESCNKLLTIIVFILDFLCIHPYNHGNGRLSRLVLNFLLKKYGYEIDDYYSISYLVKARLGDYIDAFKASVEKWQDNENDYSYYVTFMLKTILEAYRKVDYIIEVNNIEGTAEDKTLRVINDSATPVSKNVVEHILYSASITTVEKALSELVKKGKVQLITKGRYSRYFRI